MSAGLKEMEGNYETRNSTSERECWSHEFVADVFQTKKTLKTILCSPCHIENIVYVFI